MTVLVAIADVDAVVAKGSPVDRHAAVNTTSVYTPAAIFPMLPERLSTDLTSLNDHEDRLAIVIELTVAADGTLAHADLYRAIVRNRAKLAYNAVGAWLAGEGPLPPAAAAVDGMDRQLQIAGSGGPGAESEAARARRARFRDARGEHRIRRRHGPGTSAELPNRAKSLIENLMVAANGATARFLDAAGLPSIRRVVRQPARWDRIVAVAAQLGAALPAAPDAVALAAFLIARKAAEPATFADLSLAIIKLMGPGEYVIDRPGGDPPGPLRPRGQGLHALDGAEPALSGSGDGTPRQSGVVGAPQSVFARRTGSPRRSLHRAGGRREQGRAAGPQVGGGARRPVARRRAVPGHRDRGVAQGDVRAGVRSARRRHARLRESGRRRRRSRLGAADARRRGTRLHRFRSGP